MTTKWIGPDFPGAYSGKVRSWERKKREEIGLLPDKHGFSPGIVLGDKPAETIMATAVQVPQCERKRYGSSYIGVMEGKMITPRKLASSLMTKKRRRRQGTVIRTVMVRLAVMDRTRI